MSAQSRVLGQYPNNVRVPPVSGPPRVIAVAVRSARNARLSDPKVKAQLADMGGTALALSPAEFGKLIAQDTEKWAKVIRAANIKAE